MELARRVVSRERLAGFPGGGEVVVAGIGVGLGFRQAAQCPGTQIGDRLVVRAQHPQVVGAPSRVTDLPLDSISNCCR